MEKKNAQFTRSEDYTLGPCIEDLLPREDRKAALEYERPNALLLLESIKLYNDSSTKIKIR